MKLYVKRMMSNRCKVFVRKELDKSQLRYFTAKLGVIDVIGEITEEKRNLIEIALQGSGLKLIEDQPETLIIIAHKIERMKEFISYNELTFSKIAFKQYYSSIKYLSNQFKKVTGSTLSFFRTEKCIRHTNIENL